MITIRPLEEKDVTAVSEIESRTFSMPWKEKDFLEMVKADYAYYYVAEEDGVILGCCGLRNMAGEGEITNVAVDAPFREKRHSRKTPCTCLERGCTARNWGLYLRGTGK